MQSFLFFVPLIEGPSREKGKKKRERTGENRRYIHNIIIETYVLTARFALLFLSITITIIVYLPT